MLANWRIPTDVASPDWRPLADLWPPPPGTPEIELYLCALLTVTHIVEVYGEESLPLMLDAVKSADSVADWVTAVIGRPLAEFEADWREWAINRLTAHSAIGSIKEKTLPSPSWLRTQMRPLCFSMIDLTRARPRPEPTI